MKIKRLALDPDYRRVVAALKKRPRTKEELAEELGLEPSKALLILDELARRELIAFGDGKIEVV